MQIARRICLPWWSFLLICAAAMAITALVVYEATTEPEPEAPVSYSFQPETGALTFYIPEGWELLRVFTDEGALTIPPYHQDTRSLTIDLTELPETGGRDLIHIQCLPPEEGLLPFSFFEVLRQSTGGEFILYSSPDQLNWTWESVFYQPTTSAVKAAVEGIDIAPGAPAPGAALLLPHLLQIGNILPYPLAIFVHFVYPFSGSPRLFVPVSWKNTLAPAQ